MEVVRRLKGSIFQMIWKDMENMVRVGAERKAEALHLTSFGKLFSGRTLHEGAYWLQQRKDSFRKGLERVYGRSEGRNRKIG